MNHSNAYNDSRKGHARPLTRRVSGNAAVDDGIKAPAAGRLLGATTKAGNAEPDFKCGI